MDNNPVGKKKANTGGPGVGSQGEGVALRKKDVQKEAAGVLNNVIAVL